MKPVTGFMDRFGVDLRRRRYLGQVFGTVAESFGFEPLEVPIVERAEAYSEEVVGLSPWPEWNPKGVIGLSIANYKATYEDDLAPTAAVLIPEGTLSVTRWLGDKLSPLPDPRQSPDLPLKIYYEIGCYRNELLDTLSSAKGRQFTQFGIEILGSSSVTADLEVMSVSAEALRALGVSDSAIVFRISSNRLYSDLSAQSGLSHRQSIALKEDLDTIGECKAGKRPERLPEARASLMKALVDAGVSPDATKLWTYVVDRPAGPVSARDFDVLSAVNEAELAYLDLVSRTMAHGTLAIDVEFCVVRSHEYYTGLTFEIDLIGPDGRRFVEVGGGGRYDRLLGKFVDSMPGVVIPSMGYAFGMERLQAALVETGHLQGIVDSGSARRNLSDDPVVSESLPRGTDTESAAGAYLASVEKLRARRAQGPVSVNVK